MSGPDNPISWMVLTVLVIFFIARFVKNAIAKIDRIEREDREEWLNSNHGRNYY